MLAGLRGRSKRRAKRPPAAGFVAKCRAGRPDPPWVAILRTRNSAARDARAKLDLALLYRPGLADAEGFHQAGEIAARDAEQLGRDGNATTAAAQRFLDAPN